MFWGVTLETGKRYSQTVDQSYHLTQAALEPPSGDGKKPSKYVSVMVEHEKSEFMICTLEPDRNLQVPLDHMFVEGEEVTYYLTGEGTVHLTGYLVYGDDYDDFDEELDEEEDEESEEEEDDSVKVNSIKRKNEALESPPEIGKKAKVDPKLQTQNKALKADVKQVAKKNEQKDNALNKSKNQNQVLKTNAINNRKQSDDSDEEDSDGGEEESDEDMDDSLGLIDKEAVEADDSDDEEEDEEDSSDDESDESPQKNSIPNKGKQNKQNQQKQQQNKQQNQQQNKNKQQNQPNQQNKSPQNNQQNKSPQNQQKPFGSGQKGGFQGNQKGGQFQKGNWNQSGQKKPFGGNQNSGQKPFGGNQNSGQKPNQWQNKKQFGGQNQGKDQQFGGQNNSPNFKGKPQTPNFKGPQRGNFNQTPNSNQKARNFSNNKKPWNSDRK